jgi:tetratricopeptide (TPR) repeat protein
LYLLIAQNAWYFVAVVTQEEKLLSDGYSARREKRLGDARDLFAEAVSLCRSANDQGRLAKSLTGLGQIERDLGDHAAALRNYQDALLVYRALGDADRVAHTVRHLADILRHEGRVDEARLCYQEALEIYRARGETSALDLANAFRGYALLCETAGETQTAKELWGQAKRLYASLSLEVGVNESDRHLNDG